MAAVVLLRASSRVSLIRAASLPAARNVSAGRLYYLTSDKRTFSNSTRTLEPVKELSVPEKSEPKTAGVEGPHRRARDFFLIAIFQLYNPSYCLQTIIHRRRHQRQHRRAWSHLRRSQLTLPAIGCSSTLSTRKKN